MAAVEQYDGEPPAEPPVAGDCLIWRLAHGLHADHQSDRDGFCVCCRKAWPCAARQLAVEGLRLVARMLPAERHEVGDTAPPGRPAVARDPEVARDPGLTDGTEPL